MILDLQIMSAGGRVRVNSKHRTYLKVEAGQYK
jgi:hypothetical protein